MRTPWEDPALEGGDEREGIDKALSDYTAPSPQGEASSLLGALSPRRNVSSLMLPLMLSQMQQPQQNYGDVFLNSFYGAQGRPNPVLQQQMVQQHQQQQMQMGIVDMISKMGARQEASDLGRSRFLLSVQNQQRQEQRDERTAEQQRVTTLIPMIDKLKTSDSEAGRLLGFQEESRLMQKMGGPGYSPDIIRELSTKTLSPERMKDIVGYIQDGVAPEEIATVYKVPLARIQEIQGLANSPEWARKYAEKIADADWKQEERGLKRQHANLEQMKFDQQVKFQDASLTQQAATAARQERMFGLAERRADQADTRNNIAQQALDRKISGPEEKKKATLDIMEDTLNQLELRGKLLNDKKLIAQGPGVAADLAAKFWRAANPGDDDVRLFKQVFQGMGVGFERSVQNDIGPRALAAYKGMLSWFDNPPPYQALLKSTQAMRRQLDIARGGGVPDGQKVVVEYTDPQTKQRARREIEWAGGIKLPPDAKILSVDGDLQ